MKTSDPTTLAPQAPARRPAKARTNVPMEHWLRVKKKFPHLWCPGCGLGIVLGASIRAFDALNYNKDDMVLVAGIGCTGRIPVYVDSNTLHTTHGRALAFATGVKVANPKLKVVVFMGDGDAVAIGGNHFIHACRRNIDLTAIVVNNSIYGMTGGQASPTTPLEAMSTTTPEGVACRPFDICDLARGSGATYVARSTTYHTTHLNRVIQQALEHKGFSIVEVISNCHTSFGRLNKLGSHLNMLKDMRDNSVMVSAKMDPAQAKATGKKYVLGVMHHDTEAPEYCQRYLEAVKQLNNGKHS